MQPFLSRAGNRDWRGRDHGFDNVGESGLNGVRRCGRIERDGDDQGENGGELECHIIGFDALAAEKIARPRVHGVERGVEMRQEIRRSREVVALARDSVVPYVADSTVVES